MNWDEDLYIWKGLNFRARNILSWIIRLIWNVHWYETLRKSNVFKQSGLNKLKKEIYENLNEYFEWRDNLE